MAKRNVLHEIRDRKRRSTSSDYLRCFVERTDRIAEAHKSLLASEPADSTACHSELSRYFPTAFVAALEGYFRAAVADLIDRGSPFVDRAASLQDAKISIPVASAMQNREITLGEYIAHFIRMSCLADINQVLTCLLGFDFLERLVTAEFDVFEGNPISLREHDGDFIGAVNDLFSIRHQLCHEFAEDVACDNAEIFRFYTCADVLVALSEVVVQGAVSEARRGDA